MSLLRGILVIVMPCVLIATARAEIVGLWQFEEGSGSTAFNTATPIGTGWSTVTDAAIAGTPGWTTDATRGSVLSFDTTNHAAVGWLPEITATTDFTLAFWSNSAETGTSTVMVGNRHNGSDTDQSWMKFTPRQFEYTRHYLAGGSPESIDYADVTIGQWTHHTVVKSGDTLSYYRNGYFAGSMVTSETMPSIPFGFGQGYNGAEPWTGMLDDVVLYDTALTNGGVQATMNGQMATAESVPAITMPDYQFTTYDDFESGALDTEKWRVYRKGLESSGGDFPYTAEVQDGQLVLGISDTGVDYWNGVTAEAAMTFNTSEQGVFSVGRAEFEYNSTIMEPYTTAAARCTMWLYADDTHYFVFSENRGETGWSYNYCDGTEWVEEEGEMVEVPIGPSTGSGVRLYYPSAGGDHEMTISLDPQADDTLLITMNIDGTPAGSQVLSNWPVGTDYRFMLSAMGRCMYDDGTAYFEDVAFLEGTGIPDGSGIDGDLNGDGYVGSADLDIVRAAWGQAVTGGAPEGDPSLDGMVGSADLDIVRANWGRTSAAAVPEPSSFALLLLGAAALLRFWSRWN